MQLKIQIISDRYEENIIKTGDIGIFQSEETLRAIALKLRELELEKIEIT